MFGATTLLTLTTLAGLVAGFAREWLFVANWGAGSRTDTFLVAMFLPEAIRTILSGGVLSAACLPLWQRRNPSQQLHWLAGQFWYWLAIGIGLTFLVMVFSGPLVQLIGSGLSQDNKKLAVDVLFWLSLTFPGLLVQAVLTVPAQAKGHFLWAGMGSLLFNLPAVTYLWLKGSDAQPQGAALSFVLGSLLSVLVLLPGTWSYGWRPWQRGETSIVRETWKQLWPLLVSSGASQGLAWLERVTASFLGEGSITLVNLARKLINIPLIALMSLNQVLLSRMSAEAGAARRTTLNQGLFICAALTLPAAVGFIIVAPTLVFWAFPAYLVSGPLPGLLSLFSVSIVFGSWNALLARFYYASGDTRGPLACELRGSLLQGLCLLGFPWVLGLNGIALAAMAGVISTGIMLTIRLDRQAVQRFLLISGLAFLCCMVAIGVQQSLRTYSAAAVWVGAFSASLLSFCALWGIRRRLLESDYNA